LPFGIPRFLRLTVECEASLQSINEVRDWRPIALRGAHQKQNPALSITARIDIDDVAIAPSGGVYAYTEYGGLVTVVQGPLFW